jgi:hypothetical protein
MAKPAAPSIGSRMLYFPALPKAPTTGAAPPADINGQVGPFPALAISVGGSAPDHSAMLLVVFGPDGGNYLRTGVVNIATWSSAGSSPYVARWDYVDLAA